MHPSKRKGSLEGSSEQWIPQRPAGEGPPNRAQERCLSFHTEVYRSELAYRLRALGYELRSGEHGFEIAGVSQEIIDRFSKRRRAILDAEAKVAGKLGQPLSNNARATLAHTSRQAKDTTLDPQAVLEFQRAQLTPEELSALTSLVPNGNRPAPSAAIAPPAPAALMSPGEAIDYARDHHFERQSVVETYELLKTALAYSRGSVRLDRLQAELAQRSDFLHAADQLTSPLDAPGGEGGVRAKRWPHSWPVRRWRNGWRPRLVPGRWRPLHQRADGWHDCLRPDAGGQLAAGLEDGPRRRISRLGGRDHGAGLHPAGDHGLAGWVARTANARRRIHITPGGAGSVRRSQRDRGAGESTAAMCVGRGCAHVEGAGPGWSS